jgi:hypothetical protein
LGGWRKETRNRERRPFSSIQKARTPRLILADRALAAVHEDLVGGLQGAMQCAQGSIISGNKLRKNGAGDKRLANSKAFFPTCPLRSDE